MDTVNPLSHYRDHEPVYDSIEACLDRTFDHFLDADRPVQRVMLHRATTFALCSIQTQVSIHEAGYLNVVSTDRLGQNHLANILQDAGVNYCQNKARYTFSNLDADADRVIDHVEAGSYVDALDAVQDEYLGCAMAKGAFSLALLGVPKMACLDTHAGRVVGLDSEEVYSGTVPERYMEQVRLLDDLPVADRFDRRFMTQWLAFDADIGAVNTHDAWFMSIPTPESVVPGVDA